MVFEMGMQARCKDSCGTVAVVGEQ
jgi:hypothetical protein